MATVAKNTRSTTVSLVSPSAGPFLLGFRLFDDDAVRVYVDGVANADWTLTSSYSSGYDDNASITFASPILAGSVILIDAALAPWFQDDLVNGDQSLVQKLNIILGRLWSSISEIRRDADRTVRGFVPLEPVDGIDLSTIGLAPSYAAAAAASASASAASAAAAAAAQNTILKPKGQWITATAYVLGDLVYQTGSQYECITAHTSGTFATDLSASRWRIFVQQGASGAGTGDVLAANSGSEYAANAQTFRANLSIPVSATTKISSVDILTKAYDRGGFWNIGTGNTNAPAGAADGDHIMVKRFDDTNMVIVWFFADGNIAINKKNANVWTGWIYQSTQAFVADSIAVQQQIMHVREAQASGVSAGTSTTSYTARVLNVATTNTIPGASLSANRIVLPAGIYDIDASAPAFRSDRHNAYLHNVNDVSVAVYGTSEVAAGTDTTVTRSFIRGRFAIAAPKAFEIRHRVEIARAGDGFGLAAGFGQPEIYTSVFIKRVT